jgi:hypothetical protein
MPFASSSSSYLSSCRVSRFEAAPNSYQEQALLRVHRMDAIASDAGLRQPVTQDCQRIRLSLT